MAPAGHFEPLAGGSLRQLEDHLAPPPGPPNSTKKRSISQFIIKLQQYVFIPVSSWLSVPPVGGWRADFEAFPMRVLASSGLKTQFPAPRHC